MKLGFWIAIVFVCDLPSNLQLAESIECTCGQINNDLGTRVVGGFNTNYHRYPWLALILKNNKFHCSGSIINNMYILTAGHCVHKGDTNRAVLNKKIFTVILGVYDRANDHERTRRYFEVVDIKVPKVKHTCAWHEIHDIALLKTNKPIEFNWAISPVCLPRIAEFDYIGKLVTVAGWGTMSYRGKLSRYPREGYIKVLDNEECLKTADVGFHFSENPMAAFCAYKSGTDACKGDSGGPVAIDVNNTMVQIGIVSWGIECALDQHPGVYTRLPFYLYWLFQNSLDAEYCDA